MPKALTNSTDNATELLKEGKSSSRGLLFERFSIENARIHNKDLRQCYLEELDFKKADVRDCNFFHTRFTDCYFKNAALTRVRFVDCYFDHCDFDGAVFSNCGLEYSEFRDCRITYRQIESCLPLNWQNVLLRLARSLRMNAHSMGDYDEYRRFLSLELDASEMHYKYIFTNFVGYYAKYSPMERVHAFRKWVSLKIDRFLWGHGEDWTRVLLVACSVILSFALLFRYCAALENMPDRPNFLNYLAFSASNFLTIAYGRVMPADGVAQLLQILEAAMGFLLFGLLVTSLYVRISKR